jgi:hypothetical protein
VSARLADVPAHRPTSQVERLTLFLCALHRDQAEALLLGLADEPALKARAFRAELTAWDSSRRQARLALEFGPRDRPRERAQRLILEAPPPLRAALAQSLPPKLRRHFPHLVPAQPAAPALCALAARLVREALG